MDATQDAPLYAHLARAFAAEDVDTQFVLMGDGNMHFSTALDAIDGVLTVHVRHEHCAVAAATAYALKTEKVGVASLTCGPGLSQVMTALPAAVRAQVPLVVFTGETPINAKFYNQEIDQAPLVKATGAHYIAAHSTKQMLARVREAFHIAKYQRQPVVIGIPYDMQKQKVSFPEAYVPATAWAPDGGRPMPDPAKLADLAAHLKQAKCPVLIAGRGAHRSAAKEAMVALADASGAILSNTLPVRGMFDDHPFSIGVAGGYVSELGRDVFASADLVIAFGAGLTYYTKDGGNLFPQATTAQVDLQPRGLKDGMKAADLFITADAKATAEALTAALDGATPASTVRTDTLRERIATEAADTATFEIAAGVIDPRAAVAAIDKVIPNDWDMITGSGHQAYFNSQIRGRPPERFLTVREFGAIGNGLSYTLGVAAARRKGNMGTIVLIEGDGGFIMHIQELETLKRQGFRVLMCVLNDGAYGSEIHKLRSEGISDHLSVFGRPPFEAIAQGFGLRGAEVTDVAQIPALFEAFAAQGESEVWNIQISDQVTAPTMRKTIQRGHGVM
jgi:acetolactate synthase-1/2/3 large subunit